MVFARAGLLASRELRGSRASRIGLALVVALGGGTALGSAVVAYRTDHAYPDYVERADVAEVVINPSNDSVAMDAAIRSFDGVQSVHSDALLLATVGISGPAPVIEAIGPTLWLQVYGSPDGRYSEVDRPTITSGRAPTGDHEVFVTDGYRSELETIVGRPLQVGDVIDVPFYWTLALDSLESTDDVLEPLAVEHLRISGFGTLADEVLPDELWPRQRLIVSADVAKKYTCLPDYRADMTVEEAFAAAAPPTCSSQFIYYSLQLAPGTTPASIRDQFAAAAARLSPDVPPAVLDLTSGYFYVSQDRADLDDAVHQTTQPTVAALGAFAAVAALATLTIAGLMLSRMLRRPMAARRGLLAVGATAAQRGWWAASAPAIAIGIGLVGAIGVAALLSPLGPLGTVRVLEPSPGLRLPADVVVPLTAAFTAAVAVLLALLAWWTARADTRAQARPAAAGRIAGVVSKASRPSATTGVSAALGGRRAGPDMAVLAGAVVAIAAGSTAIVFGANLSSLVDRPAAYGWPWDVTTISGAGYGDTDVTAVEASLAQPEVQGQVADVSYFAFDSSTFLGPDAMPVLYGFANAVDTPFPILEGRAALRAGEAVIGSRTAAAFGLAIGDQLIASSVPFEEVPVTIVGIAVLPSVGPFIADRTGLGTGAFILIDADVVSDSPAAFVGIRLTDGTSVPEFVDALGATDAWDTGGAPVLMHTGPVRPPEIVNVSDEQAAPIVLGGILVAGLAIGLSLSIATSVRDRRRELAVLRALGFGDADLHASVRWHAATVAAIGVVIGAPLGAVFGRLMWRKFAEQLGVSADASVPLVWLALLAAATIALALLAAQPPSRAASRVAVADVLHSSA